MSKSQHLQEIRQFFKEGEPLVVDMTVQKRIQIDSLEEYDNYVYSLGSAKILNVNIVQPAAKQNEEGLYDFDK